MKSLFLNKTKKYIAGFLCLAFILNLFFLAPNDAKATGAEIVIDPALIGFYNEGLLTEKVYQGASLGEFISQTYDAIQNTIHNKLIELKEYVLDGLAWTAANVVIDQFGDAIVDWIRNGFDGSPMFLSDPEGFFRDTANAASGAIINDLDMGWFCDPLGKLRLNIDFFFPGTNRVKYSCTFNDIAANFENIADRDDISDWISVNANFHEKNIVTTFGNDYRNGGFLMWLFTAQKKNNDLGRTIQTASDAYIAASVSVGSEKFQLNLNQGFFGVKKCLEHREATDLHGREVEGDCIKWETKSPGTLVQDQLNNAANKDLARLQVADEIDEIIGALASTMMGWLLTGGTDKEGNSIGVLGYDKDNKDYAGSQRDHYGELSKSQQTTTKKSNISGQIVNIKSNEEQYSNSLKDYADALYGTKEKLEIVLIKLKCIKATSTSDASDDEDCDGADEDIKNIAVSGDKYKVSTADKTIDNIKSDINKTDNKISDIDGKISSFNSKYGENATSTSTQALELFDEFENKAMSAGSDEEITNTKEEYCYSYDKENKTGEICGLFGDSATYETYKTHSDKDFKAVSKETGKIEAKMKSAVLEYACILDEYTQAEDVTKSECDGFESSSSSSSSE